MSSTVKKKYTGHYLRLTFEANKFVLYDVTEAHKHHLINGSSSKHWMRNHANDSFRTSKITEAARFSKYADGRAKYILNKLALKALPLPASGPVVPSHLSLLPFQAERGVPHILGTNHTYLAHQPGLGKSAQFISAVNTKPGKALILCPSFLKVTWAREITKWFRYDFPCIEIVPESSGRHTMNWDADFVICSDSMLLKDWVREGITKAKFRFIAIDEGHRYKTPGAARTTALFGGTATATSKGKTRVTMKSPGLIYDAEHAVVLSGTPMLGCPIDLWPVLYAMAPEVIDFMTYEEFGFKYCGAFQDEMGMWHFTGSSNEFDLHTRLMGRFMQRIRKDEVLEDLPPKIRQVVLIDKDTRAKEIIALDKELSKKMSFKKPEDLETLADYATVRHETGKSKVSWAAKYVYSKLTEDVTEQIILYGYHRDVVDELEKLLFVFKPIKIYGGISEERRTKAEDEFQAGNLRLIIGNINAMNLGLTLTKATRVIFCEYSWTPADNEQAEDRAHRITQLSSVYVEYLVLPNSLDEHMLNRVLAKEDSFSKVIG